MSSRLKTKLSKLPNDPGVYFFKDARGKIIYVGKAASLATRVRSYFHSKDQFNAGDYKTPLMVKEIKDVSWQIAASEVDALFLESELIKRYRPKYNIELKDDKHYLYVRISVKDSAPNVSFVRRPMDDGSAYYGPYVNGTDLRRAMRILRKIFPYSTHKALPKRVCLQYHLGLCPGLEEAKISLDDYRVNLRKLAMFLKGERGRLIMQIEAEMRAAAKYHDFERAAVLRNQAHSLKSLARQMIFSDAERFDISRDQALNGLMQLLKLPSLPRRIEAYDISHISGTDNSASMTVFLDGVSAKSEYRRFRMRKSGNDDFAHLREVISRRFSEGNLAKWPRPDLIVIDGGKPQVAAAQTALSERGLEIPMIGLAKRLEEIVIPTSNYKSHIEDNGKHISNTELRMPGFEVIQLERDSVILQLLMRLRDEAHRFAIAYHHLLRSRRQTASTLEDIPGIGPTTRKKLIKHFGSLRQIAQADLAEITRVVGALKAKSLRNYLEAINNQS